MLDAALAQLPKDLRHWGLARGDTGSGVEGFLWHIHRLGLSYSVGVYGRQPVLDALGALPARVVVAAPRTPTVICATALTSPN